MKETKATSPEPISSRQKRNWDAAAAIVLLGLFGLRFLAGGEAPWWQTIVALLLACCAYLWLWRPAMFGRTGTTGTLASVVVVGAALAYAHPTLANGQALLFPLGWRIARTRRGGIWFSVALGASAAVAEILRWPDAWAAGYLAGQVAIIVFSVVFGLWITSIGDSARERQRLLDELRASQDQLAEASRLVGVTSERERFARDIHDTIAQSLAALVMQAEGARGALASGRDVAPKLAAIEETARFALGEARSLVAANAAVSADGTLADALDRIARRTEQTSSVAVDVRCVATRMTPEHRVVVTRIVQETLSNVARHSGARHAQVLVEPTVGGVRLSIADDGHGFDPGAPRTGFGLASIRDRVTLAGGRLDLRTSASGTSIEVVLPERSAAPQPSQPAEAPEGAHA